MSVQPLRNDIETPPVPASERLELDLLGWQLRETDGVKIIAPLLSEFQFSDRSFQAVQDAMSAISRDGVRPSAALVAAKLSALGFDENEAKNFLADCAYGAPAVISDSDLERHARAAIEAALLSRTAARKRQADQLLRQQGVAALDDALDLVRGVQPKSHLQFQASAQFVADFSPPDYLLDGVLQRRFLYALTGQTGAGKTTLTLRLMAHAAFGKALCGRDVLKCRALMLVGENADDVRARWITLAEQMGFLPNEADVHFVPGIFSIPDAMAALKHYAEHLGGVGLVVVDTSAAYFMGDEENSNKQLGDHARAIRQLTELPGGPTVIANSHPTKGAGDDNLLPRGGGAFLAEVDGNLTCSKKDGAVELHWQGKFRGPDFDPLAFALETVRSDYLRDTRGRHVPSVIARPLSVDEQQAQASASTAELRRLIRIMDQQPGASISALATAAGWSMADGRPYKSKVARLLRDLQRQHLAAKELDAWNLTPAGQKLAKRDAA